MEKSLVNLNTVESMDDQARNPRAGGPALVRVMLMVQLTLFLEMDA